FVFARCVINTKINISIHSMYWTTIFLFQIIVVVISVYKSVIIVPHGSKAIVEKMGAYNRMISSGFNMITPFIESIKTVAWVYTEESPTGKSETKTTILSTFNTEQEQFFNIPCHNAITKDGVRIGVNV